MIGDYKLLTVRKCLFAYWFHIFFLFTGGLLAVLDTVWEGVLDRVGNMFCGESFALELVFF